MIGIPALYVGRIHARPLHLWSCRSMASNKNNKIKIRGHVPLLSEWHHIWLSRESMIRVINVIQNNINECAFQLYKVAPKGHPANRIISTWWHSAASPNQPLQTTSALQQAKCSQISAGLSFLLLSILEADRSLQVDSLMLIQIYRIAAVSVQGRMSSHCTHSSSQCTDHRVSLHPEISDENAQFWVHDWTA